MRYVVRSAFLIRGERQEIGSEVEINDRAIAAELVFIGRLEPVEAQAPAAPAPMTTQSAPGIVAGSRRGGRNAGK